MGLFGDNLLFLRKKKGLTQAQMPELVRVSRATWSDYENDKTEPSLSVLIEISNVFEISIDVLLRIDLKDEDTKGNLNEFLGLPVFSAKGNLKSNPSGNLNPQNYPPDERPATMTSEAQHDWKTLFVQLLDEVKGFRQDFNNIGHSSAK